MAHNHGNNLLCTFSAAYFPIYHNIRCCPALFQACPCFHINPPILRDAVTAYLKQLSHLLQDLKIVPACTVSACADNSSLVADVSCAIAELD